MEKKTAEIEVVGLNLGDQIAAEWVPLYGISYDGRSNMVEIMLKDLNHRIHYPKRIYVDGEGAEVNSVMVTDADEVRHIVLLRAPLSLPRLKKLVPIH